MCINALSISHVEPRSMIAKCSMNMHSCSLLPSATSKPEDHPLNRLVGYDHLRDKAVVQLR